MNKQELKKKINKLNIFGSAKSLKQILYNLVDGTGSGKNDDLLCTDMLNRMVKLHEQNDFLYTQNILHRRDNDMIKIFGVLDDVSIDDDSYTMEHTTGQDEDFGFAHMYLVKNGEKAVGQIIYSPDRKFIGVQISTELEIRSEFVAHLTINGKIYDITFDLN